jgi:hypothetical protein
MKITRRGVLKVTLGGLFVAGGGGVWLSLRGTVMRTPRRALKVLDEGAFSVLAAVADQMGPAEDGWPSAWEIGVPEDIDELLSVMHPGDAADVVAALNLLENAAAGLLLDGRTQTFTASDSEAQAHILDTWRRSDITLRRTAFRALHKLCNAAYYANPSTYAMSGYPGPPNFGGGGG